MLAHRALRNFSAKPALDIKLKEVEPDNTLNFVKKSTNLRQIISRMPNDGLFPPVKAV